MAGMHLTSRYHSRNPSRRNAMNDLARNAAVRSVALVLICTLAAACRQEPPVVAQRVSESRFGSMPAWQQCQAVSDPSRILSQFVCGPPHNQKEAVSQTCDSMIKDHATAVETLMV